MKKIFLGTALLFIIILMISSDNCYASIAGFNPDDIKPLTMDDNLAGKLDGVIGIIQVVGTGVAVIAVVYLGIRYMLSSTEEKADIKKKAIPYIIGTVIFFGATGILRLIASVASWLQTK